MSHLMYACNIINGPGFGCLINATAARDLAVYVDEDEIQNVTVGHITWTLPYILWLA